MSVDMVEMVTFGLSHHAGTRGDRFFARRVQGPSLWAMPSGLWDVAVTRPEGLV